MNIATQKGMIRALEVALATLGPETSVRHVLMLLRLKEAGEEGAAQVDLQRHLDSSQPAVSRAVKTLMGGSGGPQVIEVFLDPDDYRRRLIRLNKKGEALVQRILSA